MGLSKTRVENLKAGCKPKKHTDGLGLYLLVNTGKHWRMDYRFDGKRKTLALGSYPAVSLKQARKRRDDARELLAEGIDPGQAKKEAKIQKELAAKNNFEAVTRDWLAKTAANRGAVTQLKIQNWMERDIFPLIGSQPVSKLGSRDVLLALRPMESRGALDSVARVKQHIGQVFRFAVANGLAERDVTTDLRGALATRQSGHHAAITTPKALSPLLRAIHAYDGNQVVAAALKMLTMVFLRPGELRQAEWGEFDFEAAEWHIPAERMKMKVAHIVPLSTQVITILSELRNISGHGRFVFPSIRTNSRCISDGTLNAALAAIGYSSKIQTPHGFRATARTIMDEVLDERVDIIEHQLSHAVKDALGNAYNRTSHLPYRHKMMQRWADYLDQLRAGATVTQLKAA